MGIMRGVSCSMKMVRLPAPEMEVYIDLEKIVSMEMNVVSGSLTLVLVGYDTPLVFYSGAKTIRDFILSECSNRRLLGE